MAAKHEKLIDDIKSLTLLEVSDLVKALEEAFGVSAAMPTAAAATAATTAAPAAAEAEKAMYKVTLLSFNDADKIKVIKAMKALIPNISLGDANTKVEGAPTVLAESAPKVDAAKMKAELEAAGAKVELA
jgi:large subunit ribosomal protein L7/L12